MSVDIKHRNSIGIWSKNPVSYSSSTGLNFDFTSAGQSAFGDNLTLRNGKWCLYSGDINRDEMRILKISQFWKMIFQIT
ncbi:MAG: hypothetical protein IPH77_06085 [Ignavibacteria bacterium]|nr:hypothetical protein [Ignavibacteria bacterium]